MTRGSCGVAGPVLPLSSWHRWRTGNDQRRSGVTHATHLVLTDVPHFCLDVGVPREGGATALDTDRAIHSPDSGAGETPARPGDEDGDKSSEQGVRQEQTQRRPNQLRVRLGTKPERTG